MANIFDDGATFKDYYLKSLAPSTLSYNPISTSGDRTITAVVNITNETEFSDSGDETTIEVMRVLCDRDASSGIDDPQLGDLVTRSVTDDTDRRPFVFTGEKEDITGISWVLLFSRHMPIGRGPR